MLEISNVFVTPRSRITAKEKQSLQSNSATVIIQYVLRLILKWNVHKLMFKLVWFWSIEIENKNTKSIRIRMQKKHKMDISKIW